MRICFLLHQGNMYSGGQGVYLHYLTRELVGLGHEVHAIVGPPYPEVAEGVRLHRLRTYSYYRLMETGRRFYYGRPPLEAFLPLNLYELVSTRAGMFSVMTAFSFRAYDCFRRLAQERAFDVVHDNQVLGYGTLLIKAGGVPVVATIHHPLAMDRANAIRQGRSPFEKVQAIIFYPFFMQELVARRLDRIVTVSPQAAGAVRRAFRLRDERIAVVHNGVDTDVFRPSDEVAKRQRQILFVGNSNDPNKGARYLLEALALLRPDCDARLALVGRDMSDDRVVPPLIERYGLAECVEYVGTVSREELVRRYRESQVLVSPSLFEGFGLPAVEAMACGLPVVTTRAGAFPEIVEDGVNGLVVPPADAPALAAAVRRLLSDPDLCRRMGHAARERITRDLTWRRAAEKLVQVYEEVGREARTRS
jgi:glycosyltransferase involved in cell wall biosynthesis